MALNALRVSDRLLSGAIHNVMHPTLNRRIVNDRINTRSVQWKLETAGKCNSFPRNPFELSECCLPRCSSSSSFSPACAALTPTAASSTTCYFYSKFSKKTGERFGETPKIANAAQPNGLQKTLLHETCGILIFAQHFKLLF